MAKQINLPQETRPAHTSYVTWLNSMLNGYKQGFYDDAIQNIIGIAFIKKHNIFTQELYQGDGKVYSYFLTLSPTSSVPLLMIHDSDSGLPVYYNSEDTDSLFELNSSGILTKFYAETTINLKDSEGNVVGTVRIEYENLYGIKSAMVEVRLGSGLLGKGFIDVVFETRQSGTYSIENSPLEDYPNTAVTNTSRMKVELTVPVLPKFEIKFEIPAGRTIQIPSTESALLYLNSSKIPELLKIG